MATVSGRCQSTTVAQNSWDIPLEKLSPELSSTFANARDLAPKEGFYNTSEKFVTVGFERFLESECAAYCIQKSLLVKLLIDRIEGLEARLVTGAVVSLSGSQVIADGHSWIEITNGGNRPIILDPEHELVGIKGEANYQEADWFWFGNSNRRENQYYPIVIDVGNQEPIQIYQQQQSRKSNSRH